MSKLATRDGIGSDLLDWYEATKRDLPWRRTRDPYAIWVSEVMLQQTRVETVIPYWERFLERFPTIEALADAPEPDVLKLWEGLGYYSRVRNLQKAAQVVKERHHGIVPDNLDEMRALPGVGPYTAGAVQSIAYDRDVPAVDGNVFRVLSRLYLIEDDIMKPKTRKIFEDLAEFLIPAGRAAAFNQGLMELGARVCVPKNPRCGTCPVQAHCKGFAEGVAESLPVKEKKKPPRPVDMTAAILRDGDRVLIRRRPDKGLLASLWEFPGGERLPDETLEQSLTTHLCQDLGLTVEPLHLFAQVEHTFSHLHWNLRVYECAVRSGQVRVAEDVQWVALADLEDFAFPVAHQKIVKQLVGLI
ncbi:A/G-specific adenine glycosylase [Tumebacillus permanentifrigoris]|uniref:Adenine DNA glycosylase n=1 Tax=Tumebacillus permanentifrigoris TaxID=378543 RepID=A0A316D9X1_9BACL|nr:A/G-specific adenine glycosylase [Tumebacillus permanentifrigoris]PWK13749.1 A/G-specific DNA-adenine glycosylase [Tumebacillus permanentifrigoris]